jgi:hypothetical protein
LAKYVTKYSNEMNSLIIYTKFVLIWVAVSLVVISSVASAQGQPPSLPCNFHGTVQLDNSQAANGTVVAALIGDNEVGNTTVKTVNGYSTYSLMINPSEDVSYSNATVIEFTVNGYLANETGNWQTGMNVLLNLTASTPPPTPTPTPTPMLTLTPTPTFSPTPTVTVAPPTPTPTGTLSVWRIIGVAFLGILAILLLGVLIYFLIRWFVRQQ